MNYFAEITITVAAVFISVAIVLALESLRKAKLRFSIGETAELKPNELGWRPQAKWSHVYVYNQPMPKWLSWVFDRTPALACRGWITFHDLDGQDLFDRRMQVRWSNNPEPLI